MGESFALPVHNNVLPEPALASADDDDEPPSSGSHHPQSLEVAREPHTRFPPTSNDGTTRSVNDITVVSNSQREERVEGQGTRSTQPFARLKAPVADPEKRVPLGRPSVVRAPALTKLSRLRALFTPMRPLGPRPTYAASFKAALKYTPLNIFLVFIPISWALHFTHQSPTLVFVFSALGIVPLAALLGFGTEQIAIRTSQSVGGLLNATLGNIVEMIIAGIALKECKLELVQSSLLGGLLSNLLLVLGMAFIVGGFRFHQQEFQPMVAQLNSSLMTVSVISLIVPAAFHEYIGDRLEQGKEVAVLLQLSRGSAIILIFIYVAYLFFQFYSHNHLFLDTFQSGALSPTSTRSSFGHTSIETLPVPITSSSSSSSSEPEHLKLNVPIALLLLGLSTALAYITAEHLIDSLNGLTAAHPNISTEWITLIVIPIIGNAAEHTTAVVVASKGKFDLAMSVAVGSCIQIALFVIPVLVLVAWGMDKPLTLLFDPLETLVLFFSVLLVKFSVEDGKSHWLSGVVFIAVYVLIALSFWNFPETVRTLQGEALVCT